MLGIFEVPAYKLKAVRRIVEKEVPIVSSQKVLVLCSIHGEDLHAIQRRLMLDESGQPASLGLFLVAMRSNHGPSHADAVCKDICHAMGSRGSVAWIGGWECMFEELTRGFCSWGLR